MGHIFDTQMDDNQRYVYLLFASPVYLMFFAENVLFSL